MRPAWYPEWSGDVCAIIAGGPSVDAVTVAGLQGRCRVLVVNNSFDLAPWADALYAADEKWWDHYKAARDFAGLKITPSAVAAKRYGLKQVALFGEQDCAADRIDVDQPGTISRGGNGGFQSVNLVTQFNCKCQIWIGFDFCDEHWHGKHPEPLKNPRPQTLEKWRKRLDAQAATLASLGVQVLNCSEKSMLQAYDRMTVDEALTRWRL